MSVTCYLSVNDGRPLVCDGEFIYSPDEARQFGRELIDAADRADRGEFDQ